MPCKFQRYTFQVMKDFKIAHNRELCKKHIQILLVLLFEKETHTTDIHQNANLTSCSLIQKYASVAPRQYETKYV